MELRIFPALILFLGSYFPLSLILLVQNIKEKSWAAPICNFTTIATCNLPELLNSNRAFSLFFICATSLLALTFFLKNLTSHSHLIVVDSKPVPNDLINYVFPYVVSFIGLKLGEDGSFYSVLLFMALMFIITYRSGQVLMNPMLLAAGWQLYELNVSIEENKKTIKALSNNPVRAGDQLESCLVQGIYVLHQGSK